MTDSKLTVVVCCQAISNVIDDAAFEARFPAVSVVSVDYDLPHEELVRRADRTLAPTPDRLTADQLESFARADVLVGLNVPLALAQTAPRVTWIQAAGSGVGQFVASGVDGLIVTNAAGVGAPPIAEWVLAQILAIYKQLALYLDQQSQHLWQSRGGSLLLGRRAVVVGTGAIGGQVATRLHAFGVQVAGVRRRVVPGSPMPDGIADLYPVDRLLEATPSSDIVVAAVPGTPATEDMFDREFFASMKPGSIFLNVGRGTSVDETALMDALASGHLRAAAIDVAKREPLPADDPLWDVPNLYITPHSSSSGTRYYAGVWDLFCDNLERFLQNKPLRNVVDVHAEYS